ncbi:uncharacterized protein [Antedon mediterranea]|uniref:uncharacterized protein n=1 Tax=Antedon mediterranea TaxID=105859 RepID=UPI003AF43F0C
MEYFVNSRPLLIPSYHSYLNLSSARSATSATIRGDNLSSVLPVSNVHRLTGNRVDVYQYISCSPENVILRSWLHLRSYAANILNHPQHIRPFVPPFDNTFGTYAFSQPISIYSNINSNSTSSFQVYSNDSPSSNEGSGWICDDPNNTNLGILEDNNRANESRTAGRRKPRRPQKSAVKGDPTFRGVAFYLELRQGRIRLRTYSGLIRRKYKSYQQHKVKELNSSADSISELEIIPSKRTPKKSYTHNEIGKICSSCGTKKTPLWRDAEDGTPLCNACGIRYKKYRIRCVSCWFIPRKEGKANTKCHRCGDPLRVALTKRRYAGQQPSTVHV